jgi:hypothetical protein
VHNEFLSQEKPWWLFLLCGTLTGLFACLLYHINQLHGWNNNHTQHLGALLTFVSYSSLAVMLSYNGKDILRLVLASVACAAILAYFIWTFDSDMNAGLIFYSLGFLTISIYASLCFLQSYHACQYERPPYSLLFACVWENVSLLVGALVYVVLLNLILALGASLFAILGIDFFLHFFFKNINFLSISTPIFLSMGFYFCYRQRSIMYSIRSIVLIFFKVLLLVLSIFGWIFLIILMDQLIFEDQKHFLLNASLGLQCLLIAKMGIIFINAVFQEGASIQKVGKYLRYSVNSVIYLLPCLISVGAIIHGHSIQSPWYSQSAIGFYAYLAFLSAYAACYFYGSFEKVQWLGSLKKGNVYLAWGLIGVTCLLNFQVFTRLLPEGQAQASLYKEPIQTRHNPSHQGAWVTPPKNK